MRALIEIQQEKVKISKTSCANIRRRLEKACQKCGVVSDLGIIALAEHCFQLSTDSVSHIDHIDL